jgi:hypothetical protein
LNDVPRESLTPKLKVTIDTPNTQIHDRSLSWLDTATSMKRCVMGPNLLGKVVKTKSLIFQRISNVQRIDVTITYIFTSIGFLNCSDIVFFFSHFILYIVIFITYFSG